MIGNAYREISRSMKLLDEMYRNDDNPEYWFRKSHSIGAMGIIADQHIKRKKSLEAIRRDEDYYNNTGQSWKNSPYPFLAYSETWTGRNGYGSADAFEATERVVSLYSNWWKKW